MNNRPYTFYSESGASLVEVMVASSILLTALGATYSYISSATAEVKARTAVSASSSLESSLVGLTRAILESESKTDPCLHTKNLKNEISSRQGKISSTVSVEKFDSKQVSELKNFLGTNINANWTSAFQYCAGGTADRGCLLLEVTEDQNKERRRIALAVLQQTPFDFSTKKPISRATCDNTKILTDEKEGAGKGLKATYLLLTATRVGNESGDRVVLRKALGEVLQTSGKAIEVAGTSEFDPERSPSCTYDWCATSKPPDPGKGLSAWASYPKGISYNASFCGKCERAPDYK